MHCFIYFCLYAIGFGPLLNKAFIYDIFRKENVHDRQQADKALSQMHQAYTGNANRAFSAIVKAIPTIIQGILLAQKYYNN